MVAVSQHSLIADYNGHTLGFDEMLDASGTLRPHWTQLVSRLDALGATEVRNRADAARRMIDEQGITYNVYGDPRGNERPWQLDPIPFMLSSSEWTAIESALIQRATLINRVLADCYGTQELIRSARLPPALVFAQPDFLRPAHRIRPINGTFLHFYAADLGRSPDGRWWVLSDRTQIPTGLGYALANRLVASRALPETYRKCGVRRVAGYFREVRAMLASLAHRPTEEPRVVIFTPGPFNETYFEQAYLARYLGYALVEGQDLTVRDERVYLKTLTGLEPVDVILRRVDDDFCDPLELRSDSILGVPGLVEAYRAGNVAISNALGAGLLQNPAFMSFFPGLCRHVLGEELRMPSVATWWCGQKAAESYVLNHLDSLDVRPAFGPRRGANSAPISGDVRERILFDPHMWAAQERVPLSTVPCWNGEQLVPQPAAFRVYLTATPGGGYVAMPGGLTRIGGAAGTPVVAMQRGGSSKDTWVLSEGPVEDISLLPAARGAVELRRVRDNLPSRLAENFFWLGRYTSRADVAARMLRSTLLRFNSESVGNAESLIAPLLRTLEINGHIPAQADRTVADLETALLAAVYQPDRPGSLRAIADRVEQIAMFVRERTSNDMWRALSRFNECVTHRSNARPITADAIACINGLILQSASFNGFARENMTRALAWRFLDVGHRIERALAMSSFLEYSLQSRAAENPSLLESVLEVADNTLTYRTRYSVLPTIAAVYDLVILDETNPRSLLFQLLQLVKHFDRMPRDKQSPLPSAAQRILIQTVANVRLLDCSELAQRESNWHLGPTGDVLRGILRDIPALSEAIAASYFAHTSISRA